MRNSLVKGVCAIAARYFFKKISTIVYRQKMYGNNNALKKLQCEKKRSRRVSVPFALYRENRMKNRNTRQKTGFKPVLSL